MGAIYEGKWLPDKDGRYYLTYIVAKIVFVLDRGRNLCAAIRMIL